MTFHPDYYRIGAVLRLDVETGKLYWKESRGRVSKNSEAGTLTNLGYVQVRVDGKFYRRSRIVWLLVYGTWPGAEIDHQNRIKTDDRPENLQDVSRGINAANRGMQSNNTTGHTGIRFRNNSYEATKNKRYLGKFQTLQEALNARREF